MCGFCEFDQYPSRLANGLYVREAKTSLAPQGMRLTRHENDGNPQIRIMYGAVKSRPIKFCPMCGRKVNEPD